MARGLLSGGVLHLKFNLNCGDLACDGQDGEQDSHHFDARHHDAPPILRNSRILGSFVALVIARRFLIALGEPPGRPRVFLYIGQSRQGTPLQPEPAVTMGSVEAADEAIFPRLRRRDPVALEMLVREYGTPLRRAGYLYLGRADAAEDVTQETFIAAWDQAPRAAEDTQLRPWLFGILFNRCRDSGIVSPGRGES